MFSHILVPLDGSLRAERALPVAARLARATGAAVVLARVIGLPVSFSSGPAPLADVEAQTAAEREAATCYLDEVARRSAFADVTTVIETPVAAAVAPALLEIIQTSHVDLVVICSHGRTGFTRWRLGSVAQKIARNAPVPTLVLRGEGPSLVDASAGESHAIRALAPLDGSAEAETALEPVAQLIAALAAPNRGALHLLYVVQLEETPHAAGGGQEGQETLRREGDQYLRGVTERFQRAPLASLSLDVAGSVVFDADVAAAILDEGAKGYDMITMASHGRSGLQLWIMGSVTERVLQAGDLPLLIVRPQGSAPAQQRSDAVARGAIDDEIAGWPGY